MRKRKHTNDCLLRLLNLCASISFVLLIGLFAVYFLTERPEVYTEEQLANLTENLTGKKMKQEVVSDQVVTEDISGKSQLSQGEELASQQDNDKFPNQNNIQSENDISIEQESTDEVSSTINVDQLVEGGGNTQSIDKAEISKQVEETREQPTDEKYEQVPIYDAYVLMLDDHIVNQMEGVYNNGRIDYQNIVNKMFSNLSLSDQLKLLNMILSKVQNININEVWNMIKDGIDEEDSKKLQELVQENFTLEELDELYMYYQSMEIADNQ